MLFSHLLSLVDNHAVTLKIDVKHDFVEPTILGMAKTMISCLPF